MESNNKHPLQSITNTSSLSMLESLIPFVDYPLKFPLALLIKINEIILIFRFFQSKNNLCEHGLHCKNNSPSDIICALTGISPEVFQMISTLSEQSGGFMNPDILSGLSGMSGTSNQQSAPDFEHIMHMFNQGSSPPPSNPSSSEKDTSDFDFNIHRILSEYDAASASCAEK